MNKKVIVIVSVIIIAIASISSISAPQTFAQAAGNVLTIVENIQNNQIPSLQTSVNNIQTTDNGIKSQTDNLPTIASTLASGITTVDNNIKNVQNSVNSIQNSIPLDPATNSHVDNSILDAQNSVNTNTNTAISNAQSDISSHLETSLRPLNQHSLIFDENINSGGSGFLLLSDPTPNANQISNDYSYAVYSGHLTLYYASGSIGNTTGGTGFPVKIECDPVKGSYPTTYLATVDSSNPLANLDFTCQGLSIISGGPSGSVGHVWVAIEYTRLCVPNQNQAPFLICQQ